MKECPCCGQLKTSVQYRRMSCCYVDEDRNWEYTCLECHQEYEQYWEAQWKEYWMGRL